MFIPEFLKSFPREQAALTIFKEIASNKDEVERISLASKFHDDWIEKGLSEDIFPGVSNRDDFWYLFQIFAPSLHTNTSAVFDLSRSVELLFPLDVEEFFSTFVTFSPNISNKKVVTRNTLNNALQSVPTAFYDHIQLDSKQYILRFLRYDELLRSNNPYLKNLNKPILIEGSRKKNSKEYGFIGGQSFLGGKQFIDCWWNDSRLLPFLPLLVIEKLR